MEADRFEEHGRAVEINVLALDPHVAETDHLLDPVAACGNDHPVEFRVLGRPAFQVLHPERKRRRTPFVGGSRLPNFQFGNLDQHGGSGRSPRQPDIDADPVGGILVEADEIVLDEGFGNADERHVARDAAVIPPVESHRRNGIGRARVVHLHGEEIIRRFQSAGHLDLERRETALVAPDLLAVEIDPATVAYGPEMEEQPPSVLPRSVEPPGVPDRTFVVFQFGRLGIPVRGNIQPQPVFERIFVKIGLSLGFAVQVNLVLASLIVEIDDGVPFPVQRLHLASVNVGDKVLRPNSRHREERQGERYCKFCQRFHVRFRFVNSGFRFTDYLIAVHRIVVGRRQFHFQLSAAAGLPHGGFPTAQHGRQPHRRPLRQPRPDTGPPVGMLLAEEDEIAPVAVQRLESGPRPSRRFVAPRWKSCCTSL